MTAYLHIRCKEILHHYGAEKQRKILVEECAELIQATMKLERNPSREARAHFIEELADVAIMLEQMQETLTANEFWKFQDTIHQKINRQLDRIEKGE